MPTWWGFKPYQVTPNIKMIGWSVWSWTIFEYHDRVKLVYVAIAFLLWCVISCCYDILSFPIPPRFNLCNLCFFEFFACLQKGGIPWPDLGSWEISTLQHWLCHTSWGRQPFPLKILGNLVGARVNWMVNPLILGMIFYPKQSGFRDSSIQWSWGIKSNFGVYSDLKPFDECSSVSMTITPHDTPSLVIFMTIWSFFK